MNSASLKAYYRDRTYRKKKLKNLAENKVDNNVDFTVKEPDDNVDVVNYEESCYGRGDDNDDTFIANDEANPDIDHVIDSTIDWNVIELAPHVEYNSDLDIKEDETAVFTSWLPKEGFDINFEIDENYQRYAFSFTNEESHRMYRTSPDTVAAFARDIRSIFNSHGVSRQCELELYKVLAKHMPDVSFPTVGIECNDVGAFEAAHFRMLCYNLCVNSCMAFVGCDSELRACISCEAERYTKCHQKSCMYKEYSLCRHSSYLRTPRKLLYYRPLTMLLLALLETSGFVDALNYAFQKPSNGGKYKYMDVSDGSTYIDSIERMSNVYSRSCSKLPIGTNPPVAVNIVLSLFYDGAQIYSSKASQFVPLVVGILNLPPSYRIKPGVGMFLTALFTAKLGSGAESFLFDDCLISELEHLSRGVSMTIKGVTYLVQVRLKMHIYDTKGVEKALRVEVVNSLAGCPFCDHTGISGNLLRKVIYPGHRKLLPLTNYLRSFGQSRICCPAGYYTIGNYHPNNTHCTKTKIRARKRRVEQADSSGDDDSDRSINSSSNTRNNSIDIFKSKRTTELPSGKYSGVNSKNKQSSKSSTSSSRSSRSNNNSADSNVADCQGIACLDATLMGVQRIDEHIFLSCDPTADKAAKDMLQQYTAAFQFFHSDIVPDMTVFSQSLYYEHCDYRQHKPFQRVSHSEFQKAGAEAEKRGKSYGGAKGHWNFSRLPYADVEKDIDWEPFHVLSNLGKNALHVMKGDRGDSASTQAYCMAIGVHQLHTPPVWIFPYKSQCRVDACINSILIPIGYSSEFVVKNVFQQMGLLRGTDLLKILTVCLPFIVMCADYDGYSSPVAYRTYYEMISSDVIDILAPFFNDDDLNRIHYRLAETVSCREGLFPDSEALFTYHQLVHLASYVRRWGPLKGWWALPGERLISLVKRYVHKGGSNVEKTVMTGYCAMEEEKTRTAFNFDIHDPSFPDISNTSSALNLTQQDMNGMPHMKYSPAEKRLIYNDFRNVLSTKLPIKDIDFKFEEYEMESIILVLLQEADKHYSESEQLYALSPFYRLYVLYQVHKASGVVVKNCSFYNFLMVLHDNYIVHSGGAIEEAEVKFRELAAYKDTSESVHPLSYEHGQLGRWRREDLECVKSIANFSAVYYSQAYAHGKRLRGRGPQCREALRSRAPLNDQNNIWNNWHVKRQYSSWCKFRKAARNGGCVMSHYGQLNFFFRINIPADPVLHGTALASVCTWHQDRNYRRLPHGCRINLTDGVDGSKAQIYDATINFVPLTEMYSTAVLLVPFDTSDMPYNVNDRAITSENHSFYSIASRTAIKRLYLLDLHPERRNVTYEREAYLRGDYNIFE